MREIALSCAPQMTALWPRIPYDEMSFRRILVRG